MQQWRRKDFGNVLVKQAVCKFADKHGAPLSTLE